MDYETIRLDVGDRIAHLSLSRPDKLNAMSTVMFRELRHALSDLGDRWPEQVRVVLFTGDGRSFSVGGDFDDFTALETDEHRAEYMADVLDLFATIEALPIPTIAAVHGHALGGGCELSLVCDIVIAEESASFGLPEAALGLFPGIGIARGGRQLNAHWLKYMVFTGRRLDAGTARIAGLVNEVVADGALHDAAIAVASDVAARGPVALRAAKALINAGAPRGYDDSLTAIPALMATSDHAEGLEAVRERRSPEFTGE